MTHHASFCFATFSHLTHFKPTCWGYCSTVDFSWLLMWLFKPARERQILPQISHFLIPLTSFGATVNSLFLTERLYDSYWILSFSKRLTHSCVAFLQFGRPAAISSQLSTGILHFFRFSFKTHRVLSYIYIYIYIYIQIKPDSCQSDKVKEYLKSHI